MKITNLVEIVSTINDPRRTAYGYICHKLVDIIVIGLISMICGGKDYKDMEVYGNSKKEWLLGFLELPNGIPDADTFRRLFERITPDELSKCLNAWIISERDYQTSKTVSIDGKTICGSGNHRHKAYHVVTAWANEHSITLGQCTVDQKSNEITAIPELLEMIDVKGAVVTIDAMGCQKEIAEDIIGKEADYCLSLKGNQKNLHKAVINVFNKAENDKAIIADFYKQETSNGNKIEQRAVSVISAQMLPVEEREKFINMNSVVKIEHTSIEKGVPNITVRYFISSVQPNARRLAFAIKSHWCIESTLHQYLDVVFEEDSSKVKKDNSPINLNVIRKTALSLLLPHKNGRISLQKLMFRASLNEKFLELVLFG